MLRFNIILLVATTLWVSLFYVAQAEAVSTPPAFNDKEQLDLLATDTISRVGDGILCLLQHCNINAVHQVMRRCLKRSRAVANDPNRDIDHQMNQILLKMLLTSVDVGLENPKCARRPYHCADVHHRRCNYPSENEELGKIFRVLGPLMRCVYATRNKQIMREARGIFVNALAQMAQITPGSATDVAIAKSVTKIVVEKLRKLDGGRCKNIQIVSNNCHRS